jgi:UDP-N-acetyl-D-galactosamine dehydrogenase
MVDSLCSSQEAEREYGLTLIQQPLVNYYDAVIIVVAHKEFIEMGIEKTQALTKPEHVIYDLKYVLENSQVHMDL